MVFYIAVDVFVVFKILAITFLQTFLNFVKHGSSFLFLTAFIGLFVEGKHITDELYN